MEVHALSVTMRASFHNERGSHLCKSQEKITSVSYDITPISLTDIHLLAVSLGS